MLRRVVIHLARMNHTVSVIARNRDRLFQLIKDTNREPGVINALPLDYTDNELLAAKLGEAVAILGPVTTTVSWIHSTAPDAPFTVTRVLDSQPAPYGFFDILGSATGDLNEVRTGREELFRSFERLRYRQIVLGHIVENGASRWLNDQEISDGIIAAIEADAIETIIGTIA